MLVKWYLDRDRHHQIDDLPELIAAAAFDDFLADEVAEDIVLDLDEDGH